MPVCCTQLFVASVSLDVVLRVGSRRTSPWSVQVRLTFFQGWKRAVGVTVQITVLVMKLSSGRVTASAVTG